LLDLGVSPDVAPYFGRTGLHWAIPYGHLEVIRLLLERGADPSFRDEISKPTPTAGCTCSTPLAGTIPCASKSTS
jgi:ankyrin repeat protein